MKALNALFGVLILAAAVAASPAALGSILARAGGSNAPVAAHVAHMPGPLRAFELEGSGVVFRAINGKLVSRLYRVQA